MSTFLLDPQVLDDCVGDGTKDLEIFGEAFAYFREGDHGLPSYAFYLNTRLTNFTQGIDSVSRSLSSLDIFKQGYDGHHGDYSLHCQRANLIFMPVSDGDKYQWGPVWDAAGREFRERYLRSCEVLYVRGNFLKGDGQALRNYGVKIGS